MGLVDMFATKLNHLPKLRTVSLERLLDKAGPLSLRDVTGLSTGVALRYFQTRAVLTGKITALKGGFRLDILLVGRKDEDPLMEDYVVSERFEDLFSAVDSLSRKVVQSLGLQMPSQLPPIVQVSTSSLPAYRHYVMAIEDYVIADDSSLPRAVDHLHKAVAADSAFTRAHFLMAKVYDQAQALGTLQGPVQEPLNMANRFPERLPEWERQYARGWQLWLVQGDLEEAASVLSEVSKEYPDYAWHQGLPLTLGRLLAHQGRWSQAIQQLKAYVRAKETPVLRRGLGWGQLATAYQMTGDLERTIEAIEQELSLCSSHRGNRYWWIQENIALALLRFENSEQEVGEEILTGAQELVSGDARGLAMIGLAWFQMQQDKRAEALGEQALRLKGDLAAAHYLLGLISLKRKEHQQAVAYLEAACSQEYHWDYLYHAGIAHARRGDQQSTEEILTFLVDVLRGDPPQAVEPVDLGLLGILLSRLGQYDQALTHGLEGTKRLPQPYAKYQLACIHAIQGNQDKAMRCLRAAFADGYVNRRQSRTDFDLDALWYNPDFILLTAKK